MRVPHLKTNEHNESVFVEIEIPLQRDGVEQFATLQAPVAMILNQTDSGHKYPSHNAPRCQLVVTLQGEIEVITSKGSKRFGPGSMLVAEDLTGSGHKTNVVSADPWQCLYLPIPDGLLE